MRKNHTLAVLVALTIGVSAPAMAEAPPAGTTVEEDDAVRNANRRSRRARRRQRRQERRERWAEMERQRQETERQRLATQQAQAEAEAERLRRQPPVIVGAPQPVVVTQMGFNVNQMQQQAVALTTGFMPDPYGMNGFAAGRVPSRRLGLPAACPGFWTNNPQHVVSLPTGMQYFRIDVVSNVDTTLAIVTPDGQVWCNDDGGGGRNPRLEGQFPPGTYAVYVGTYQRGRRANYTVQLTERQMQPTTVVAQTPTVTVQAGYQQPVYQQQQQVQVQVQAPQPPSCRSVLLERGHHAANLQHCNGAEPYCAAALLRAGHHPANLVHCQNAPPQCAVTLLQQGHHPANLVHCQNAEPACADQLLRSGQHPANLVHCQ